MAHQIIRLADFVTICCVDDENDFAGFLVKDDGIYVQKLDEHTMSLLTREERNAIRWHPTGRYDEPALELPCTVDRLRWFVVAAGLAGSIDEEALEDRVAEALEERRILAEFGVEAPSPVDMPLPQQERQENEILRKRAAPELEPVTGDEAMAPVDRQVPTPADKIVEKSTPTCLPKRQIICVEWPLHGRFNSVSLSTALSDVPEWLKPARVARGAAGKASALWNPAILAECILDKGYANQKALGSFLGRHFADYVPEWEARQAYR